MIYQSFTPTRFTDIQRKSSIELGQGHFRFTPENGLKADIVPCPSCAMNGPHEPRRRAFYSITSSARTTMEAGTVRPSTLAVLTFTATSNLIGICTGRSAGLVPRSILST
jgi:hypothetical protein